MMISKQLVVPLRNPDLFVVRGVGDHLLECDFLEAIDLRKMQGFAL